jgi:putative phosphoesterase
LDTSSLQQRIRQDYLVYHSLVIRQAARIVMSGVVGVGAFGCYAIYSLAAMEWGFHDRMRILIVSDLHGNFPALQAVLAEAGDGWDAVFCLGDLVDYGPEPSCCVQWAQEHATHAVRGNHDHGVAQGVEIIGVSGFRFLTMSTRKHTQTLLAPEQRDYLSRLPTSLVFRLGSYRFHLVHASPRDPMDEYVPNDAEAWSTRLGPHPVDFLFAGHTHIPFQIQVGSTVVMNPGSVGLSRDGNPKARYATFENGQIHLRETAYDISRTIEMVQRSTLDPLAKKMLEDVYTQGRYVHPPGLPVPPKVQGFHIRKPA